MDLPRTLRKLLRELHRRSVWQVLVFYAAVASPAYLGVERLTRMAGLPTWTPGLAGLLLALGIPVVVATAVVQRGVPWLRGEYADEVDPEQLEGLTPDQVLRRPLPSRAAGGSWLTWRNAVLGAVGAAALLVGSVATYLLMWGWGIGPMGSLAARGEFEPGSPVLLADLGDSDGYGVTALIVTETLRADLAESRVVAVVDPAWVAEALARLGRRPGPFGEEAALEVAAAEGIPFVVSGDVRREDERFRLEARIVRTADRVVLARVTGTAREGELLEAADRLAVKVRERAGEPLRLVRAGAAVPALSPRLEAWEAFARAARGAFRGDTAEAIEWFRRALGEDEGFALAHWRLARILDGSGGDDAEVRRALQAAYDYRSRLRNGRRALVEGAFLERVAGDPEGALQAYRRAHDWSPLSPSALLGLSRLLAVTGRSDEAVAVLTQGLEGPAESWEAYRLLADLHRGAGRPREADSVMGVAAARFGAVP